MCPERNDVTRSLRLVSLPLSARLAENRRRMLDAVETSTQLVCESIRRREQRQRERPPNGPCRTDAVVWADTGDTIVCRVTPRAASLHAVEVIVNGRVIVARAFDDPVEAADEAARLRRHFLDRHEG